MRRKQKEIPLNFLSEYKKKKKKKFAWNASSYEITPVTTDETSLSSVLYAVPTDPNSEWSSSYETNHSSKNRGTWDPTYYAIPNDTNAEEPNILSYPPTLRKDNNAIYIYAESSRSAVEEKQRASKSHHNGTVWNGSSYDLSHKYEIPAPIMILAGTADSSANLNNNLNETIVDDISNKTIWNAQSYNIRNFSTTPIHGPTNLSPDQQATKIDEILKIHQQNRLRKNLHIIIPATLLLAGTIVFVAYWFTRNTSSENNTSSTEESAATTAELFSTMLQSTAKATTKAFTNMTTTTSPSTSSITETGQSIATTMSTIFDAATSTASSTLNTVTTSIGDILSSIMSTLRPSTTPSTFSSSSSFFNSTMSDTMATIADTLIPSTTTTTTTSLTCCEALKIVIDGGACPPVLNSCGLFGSFDCSCTTLATHNNYCMRGDGTACVPGVWAPAACDGLYKAYC